MNRRGFLGALMAIPAVVPREFNYVGYLTPAMCAGRARVWLDGQEVTRNCFEADDRAGYAGLFKRNTEGRIYFDRRNPARKSSALEVPLAGNIEGAQHKEHQAKDEQHGIEHGSFSLSLLRYYRTKVIRNAVRL